MQRFISFFLTFALCLAADVSVYKYNDFHGVGFFDAEPVIDSVFPWKFEFSSSDTLYVTIVHRNKAPITTAPAALFGPLLRSFWTSNITLPTVGNTPVYVALVYGTEVTIDLRLDTSNGLCTTIRIAEGRVRSKKTDNEIQKDTDICSKGIDNPCVLLVDLKDFICDGTHVAERKAHTTTARLATDLTTTNRATPNDISNFVFIILMVSVFLADQRLNVMNHLVL